jgi:hypothetical protein
LTIESISWQYQGGAGVALANQRAIARAGQWRIFVIVGIEEHELLHGCRWVGLDIVAHWLLHDGLLKGRRVRKKTVVDGGIVTDASFR